MYTVTHGTFRTPRGRSVTMAYREDTNDWNTLRSCLDEDEYRLGELTLTGTALDIGAHIGGVTVALLMDNPDLRVIAVEAVPPNVDLLRRNLEANGLSDRCTIVNRPAGSGDVLTEWGFTGNEVGTHHAFVGNAVMPAKLIATERTVAKGITLAELVQEHGPFSFAKVDCEGCEFAFLTGPALSEVALIHGEYHGNPTSLSEALYPTHLVKYGPSMPGPFWAVRRA